MKTFIFYEQALIMARDFSEPVYISEKVRILPEEEDLAEEATEEVLEHFPWHVHVGRPASYRKNCWRVNPDGRLFLHEFQSGTPTFIWADITTPEILGRYIAVRNRGKVSKDKDKGAA